MSAFYMVVIIACGLLCRSDLLDLSPFVAKYAGDALWALMMFAGIGFLVPARGTTVVAAWTAVVCGLVEISQHYHAPWIDAVRRTWLGRMALGTTFGWGDLAAYLAGIFAGMLAEWSACRCCSRHYGRESVG